MIENIEFKSFDKISRLSREIIITEKIDGTNGVVYISETGEIMAGSRNRWITPEKDNFGFAKWVEENKAELLKLGAGYHYGEWWGSGIQRGYGLTDGKKKWSLFNVGRWATSGTLREKQEYCPKCCNVVPILYEGSFDTAKINDVVKNLEVCGSYASVGFDNPEGIVIFHTASGTLFKKTIEGDEKPKSVK